MAEAVVHDLEAIEIEIEHGKAGAAALLPVLAQPAAQAFDEHGAVAEAAVVARPDDIKGSSIVAFVTLEGSHSPSDELNQGLRAHVAKEIGALARPDDIRFTDALPKTRSGKIMRRLLREIATSGSVAGDVTTLEDFSVLEKLRAEEE